MLKTTISSPTRQCRWGTWKQTHESSEKARFDERETLPGSIDLQSRPIISRFFSTLQTSAERGHRYNRGTLACDDKRTPTASKKTCVLSAVEPERCETIIISIRRTALHWRGSRTLMAEGVRGAGRIRTEERNWDHFGRAVTQYNFIFLGLLASFFFFFLKY